MSRTALPSLMVAAAALSAGCGTGEEHYLFQGNPAPPTTYEHSPPDRTPEITMIFVAPLQTSVGDPVTLSASAQDADFDKLTYKWSAHFGVITNATELDATYTCKRAGGDVVTFTVSDGRLFATHSVPLTCK